MQIKIIDKADNEAILNLEDEQVLFLVEFAIVELMKRGAISITAEEMKEGEFTLQ